jgi:hypothetical protein
VPTGWTTFPTRTCPPCTRRRCRQPGGHQRRRLPLCGRGREIRADPKLAAMLREVDRRQRRPED